MLALYTHDQSGLKPLCLQDLAPTAPLDSKVDDLLDLDEESLKEMLSPGSLEEVRTKHLFYDSLQAGSASSVDEATC